MIPENDTRDQQAAPGEQMAAGGQPSVRLETDSTWPVHIPSLVAGGVVLAAAFVWSYGPTLLELVDRWNKEPDYSHGFLVPVAALVFLWARWDRFPGVSSAPGWPGLVLILFGTALRIGSARYYIDSADGWSILFWFAGIAWLFGGWRVLWWSSPSIAFLWFMVPLPWRVERWASLPLQRVATKMSCWVLQGFGLPALSEGNTILLPDQPPMEVAEACSGLRIFVGIFALAFAYVILVRRSWWERALLLASAVPIALIANSTRIVVTGLLFQVVSGEAAHKFSHDMAGYVMILYAAGLFALVLLYLGKLLPEVEPMGVGAVVRRERPDA